MNTVPCHLNSNLFDDFNGNKKKHAKFKQLTWENIIRSSLAFCCAFYFSFGRVHCHFQVHFSIMYEDSAIFQIELNFSVYSRFFLAISKHSTSVRLQISLFGTVWRRRKICWALTHRGSKESKREFWMVNILNFHLCKMFEYQKFKNHSSHFVDQTIISQPNDNDVLIQIDRTMASLLCWSSYTRESKIALHCLQLTTSAKFAVKYRRWKP